MLDLHKGARPDERFHLQKGQPVCTVKKGPFGVWKIVRWSNLFLPDGRPGQFTSYWVWPFHWYTGNVKCDGSRSHWFHGSSDALDDGTWPHYVGDKDYYVMCTTETEKRAFRVFVDPGEPTWDNMGGS